MTDAPPQPPDDAAPPLAAWERVAVRYPYAARDAVGPVSLTVAAGERVLLLGPSGSGKSTLLQTLTGIVPQTVPAAVGGGIQINGEDVASRPPSGWASRVAQFFQDADRTLTGLRVFDEIAFVLENQGRPAAEIERRVLGAMAQVGLPEDWRGRRTSTLSGGEKQLVALAATLVADADLFVADEPTASLSPAAATRVYDLVLARQGARAVLTVDHRLDHMIGAIDRVAVLGDDGAVIAEGPPGALFRAYGDRLDALGIWTPLASRIDRVLHAAGLAGDAPPLLMAELQQHLASLPAEARRRARDRIERAVAPMIRQSAAAPGRVVASLSQASCAPLFGPTVLTGLSLQLHAGEVVGIVGPNGAGKSTLGAALAGLLRLKAGGREGPPGAIAFQNPENQFLEASVSDEVAASLPKAAEDAELPSVLERWSLVHLARQHPYELSQGEKRRLALACLTSTDRWPL
ncbi:MAG: ATP-binding cassette domain-containing protein, partial [Pseudomonadota bacterium]